MYFFTWSTVSLYELLKSVVRQIHCQMLLLFLCHNFNVLPSESDTDADLDLSVVEATFDLFFESALY